jgi:hypothetical protein
LEILTNIEQEVANISAGRALEIASLFRNALSDYACKLAETQLV